MKSVKDKWPLIFAFVLLNVSGVSCGWSEWGDYTECSRQCDGGVKYRERQCVIDRVTRAPCKGKNIQYKMCNTHECKGVSRDFRADQCSQYDTEPLDGVVYTWRPYYGSGENCKLLCFASGYPFYRQLADKVIDGTPCLQDYNRRCVDGHCKTIGCDMKIGSQKTIDKCGVCGGDNSTCSRNNQQGDVNGFFDLTRLSPGYTTIVEIPIGAIYIYVREMGPNTNSIAFWDNSGLNFAIDKDTRKVLPSVDMAGTTFYYKPIDDDNTYGGIQATGPTTSVVTVYAVNEGGDNPGIEYGYSMQQNRQPRINAPDIETYNQGRQPTSDLGPSNLRVAEPEISKPVLQPPSIVRVKTSHEPSDNSRIYAQTNVRIVDTQARGSSHSRNGNSTSNHRQFVYANNVQVLGGDNSIQENVYNGDERRYPESVDRDQVLSNEIRPVSRDSGYLGQPPARIVYATKEPDNVDDGNHRNHDLEITGASDERYLWSYGHWTECSTQCGEGVQKRIVSCVDRIKREATNERFCNENEKPSTSQPCSNRNCIADSPSSYVRWQVGSWGLCSRTCELGDQVQQVYCEAVYENGTSNTVRDEECLIQYQAKPQYRRSCNDIPCITEIFMWDFSDWRPCTVTCGEGIESRRIDCRMVGNNGRVTDDKCASYDRPVDRRVCRMTPCPTDRQRERPTYSTFSPRDCRRSRYGCCYDGVTARRSENDDCRTRARTTMLHFLVKTGSRTDLDCSKYAVERDSDVEWTKQGLTEPVYRKNRYAESINPRYKGRVSLDVNSRLIIYPAYETDSGIYTCSFKPSTAGRGDTYVHQTFLEVRGRSKCI